MTDDLTDTSLCLFNEGRATSPHPDPANDCGVAAVWHIWYWHEDGQGDMTQACDGHLTRALGWRKVVEFHEFGAACNLARSWWIPELGNCVTEETGLSLGFLKVETE